MVAVYDTIGVGYDETRQADPVVRDRLIAHLEPKSDGNYVDIACGTGNYTAALHQKGVPICGMDLSQEMLRQAKGKSPDVTWLQGDVTDLPFGDASFDGGVCILATHLFGGIEQPFREIRRVIEGRFVIFTCTPEQMSRCWLQHYFPRTMEQASGRMASFDVLRDALQAAGFQSVEQEPYFVTKETKDLFLQGGVLRPEVYLNPEMRSGVSAFVLSEDQDEITAGVATLAQDIESGKIEEIMATYQSKLGDLLFVVAQ